MACLSLCASLCVHLQSAGSMVDFIFAPQLLIWWHREWPLMACSGAVAKQKHDQQVKSPLNVHWFALCRSCGAQSFSCSKLGGITALQKRVSHQHLLCHGPFGSRRHSEFIGPVNIAKMFFDSWSFVFRFRQTSFMFLLVSFFPLFCQFENMICV